MGNVSSSGFDLSSKTGMMQLLASVRVSDIPTSEKNEIRDLVLSFGSSNDPSLRIAIEQKIITNQISPVVSTSKAKEVKPEVVLPFGSIRPAPNFVVPELNLVKADLSPKSVEPSVSEPAKLETAAVEVPDTQVSGASPLPSNRQINTASPRPTLNVPKKTLKEVSDLPPKNRPDPAIMKAPAQARSLPQSPLPSSQSIVPPVKPVVATPLPTKVADAIPNNEPAKQPESIVSDNSAQLERIRQIKAAVNDRIGNPVNLVDIDNVVGREYMTALLEAMKRVSGGAAGQLGHAMERLEKAFTAVEQVLEAHESGVTQSQEVVQQEPLEEVLSPRPAPVVSAVSPVSATPVSLPRQAIPQIEELMPDMMVTESVPVTPLPKVSPVASVAARNSIPVRPIINPATRELPNKNPNIRALNIADLNDKPKEEKSGFEDPRYNTEVPSPISQSPVAVSAMPVSQMVPPVTSPNLDKTALYEDKPIEDDLLAPEVDQGLEQLLSDWTLFKKSGLFGSGPKGREHPLFKKLAPLPMPLILAGRFEGASQDIKQSITDYMNGWRYEQGIIYEQSETFEHFLRRIIRHILNLQKRQRKA